MNRNALLVKIISVAPAHSKSFFYSRTKKGPTSWIFELVCYSNIPFWYPSIQSRRGEKSICISLFFIFIFFSSSILMGLGVEGILWNARAFHFIAAIPTHAASQREQMLSVFFRWENESTQASLRSGSKKLDLSGVYQSWQSTLLKDQDTRWVSGAR